MPLPGGPSSPGLVMPGVAMTDVRVLLPVVASSLSAGHSCHPFVFVSGGDLHLRINNRSELTVMFVAFFCSTSKRGSCFFLYIYTSLTKVDHYCPDPTLAAQTFRQYTHFRQ
ncbi:uncharacterized protein LOC135097022 isoform X6 [Scylla paramamosain]|uniref:uncharacterized protein LOC135097022 isoform X6 n=1 Tax=Scylla paramamosain TaxID=85552 RepID=UPI003082CDC7